MGKSRRTVDLTRLIRAHRKELGPYISHQTYRRRQVIFHPGDRADELYLVEAGQVKVSRVSPQGKEKIIALYLPGEIFGVMSLCEVRRRVNRAVALEPVRLTAIRAAGVFKLMRKRPEFIRAILELLCYKLVDYQDQVGTLSFDTVARRLAKELLRHSGPPRSDREDLAVLLEVSLTHEELAGLVGSTREGVTALMNQFREQGLVDYTRRTTWVFAKRLKQYLAESRA